VAAVLVGWKLRTAMSAISPAPWDNFRAETLVLCQVCKSQGLKHCFVPSPAELPKAWAWLAVQQVREE